MRILVVGSGGREHSICWAIAKSSLCRELFCAPGNAGISSLASCIDIQADDIEKIVKFAKDESIDFVIVGPETPLVLGLTDRLIESGIKTFGPSMSAAKLEGSKAYMKDIVSRSGIPTAKYKSFTRAELAKKYISEQGAPIVIKTDGLAAGKGVILCKSISEAHEAVDKMMTEKIFGESGNEVIVEEFLTGEEVSFFVLTDGKVSIPLTSAQDYKAVGDGDIGPNTGGMGAYSPAPIMTKELSNQVMNSIITPSVEAMAKAGTPYAGILFAGLMITENGPKLLEYNIRFGDPECQVLMRRIKSDLLPILIAASEGTLEGQQIEWHDVYSMIVVMAAQGYPGSYKKGGEIAGIEKAEEISDVIVFHSGTKKVNKKIIANGGRVLGVTSLANSVTQVKENVYKAVKKIKWKDGFYRNDIGWRAINLEKASK